MNKKSNDNSKYRLPRNVIPQSYILKLAPDLFTKTFSGKESIELSISEKTDEIVLNALDLNISKAELVTADGKNIPATVSLDAETERATIKLAQAAAPGKASLKLEFTGELNDKLHGFYHSVYKVKDVDGNEKEEVIATTQFESTDARRAFPCFDEPDFKATYKVTLVVNEDLAAVSNARIIRETKLDEHKCSHSGINKKEVEFAETMKMSTYLVAFIVGKLVATEPVYGGKNNFPMRVYCVPGKEHIAKFALEICKHSIEYYEDYFGIAYPGDKLDNLAIPDFASGAMENLGAVTYRETALLVDLKTASHAELERVADVVAHENAHMWFGDLATMSWWNGLWLNEAFATFLEMKAVDNFKKEWKRWNTFGVERAAALRVDGLHSTRPIEFPVLHPDDSRGMFDVLTYQKGSSVLRMLEQFIGEETFRDAIRLYLQKHSYANTETSDLWNALETVSKQPIGKIMDGWVFGSGYPLVSISPGKTDNSISVSVKDFKYLANGKSGSSKIIVPLFLKAKTADGKTIEKKVLVEGGNTEIDLGTKYNWVVANAGGHGFYRVAYNPELLTKLSNDIDSLLVIERFNLVSDTWAAVLAGQASTEDFLNLVCLLKNEEDPNVWSQAIGGLNAFYRILPQANRPSFETMVQETLMPIHKKLGWTSSSAESSQTKQLRGMVIATLGKAGNHKETQEKAKALVQNYFKDKSSVDPDVVPAVVSIYAYTGADAEYNEFNEYRKQTTISPQEETRFLFALAEFKHKHLVDKTLGACLDKTDIRTQNAPFLIANVMHNETAADRAWSFVKDNFEKLEKSYPETGFVRMFSGITGLVSQELLDDVKTFFQTRKIRSGEKQVQQFIELLEVSVALKNRESKGLTARFIANN